MSATFDPRLTAYFGDAVLQAGFMPLPHLFLRHYRSLGLSQVQAMFVLQLMEIAWDIGDPPNSVNKLAIRMGLSQRSIRACSKEVHDLGLIEIYDQWDEAGAQVENAYDLSPLFHRLAALVPLHVPAGQLRTRRQRNAAPTATNKTGQQLTSIQTLSGGAQLHVAPTHVTVPLQKSSSAPLQDSAPHPMQTFAGGPEQNLAVPPSTNMQAPPEPTITGPLQKRSELKGKHKKPKKTKKQQEHHGGVLVLTSEEPNIPPGHSLRWDISISAGDVEQSRHILERAGLHARVVADAAPTLAPAECWSLVCYARGASLGPAWIASQVYDWTRRQPQAAQLNQRYDAVGRLLAVIPTEQTNALIDITDEHCPQDAQRWHMSIAELVATLAPDERAAIAAVQDAVWTVMAEQRHAAHVPNTVNAALQPSSSPEHAHAREWSATLDILQREVDQTDWRSWLAPLQLLDVDGESAVIGAPNVFVRNEASATFAPRIAAALHQTFGRKLNVEVVIGTMVLK